MFQDADSEITNLKKGQRRQQRALAKYKKREHVWLLVVGGLVVLLILFAGYATDWGRGLRKDSSLKTATTADSSLNSQTPVDASGQTTASTKNTTNGTTTKETNTTTNNTTTSQTGGGDVVTPPDLTNLYNSIGAGDNIGTVTDLADSLGVQADCHNDILIQVCSFSQDGSAVTTKSLLGTGLVTSVNKNF